MDLVTFTEEILNEKRIFCAVARRNKSETYFIILKQSPHSKAKGFLGFHNCAIAQFHKNISIIFFFFLFVVSSNLNSLYSKASVHRRSSNQVFLIFPNIHWKATLLESLLNKVADLQPKETATQVLSYEYNEIFKNSFLQNTFGSWLCIFHN